MCAAGFSDSPHLMYSGYDSYGEWFLLFQIGFGGIPGKPSGDGPDGHSLWPKFMNVPNEFIESLFPGPDRMLRNRAGFGRTGPSQARQRDARRLSLSRAGSDLSSR
jgi:hypothetical protein